ncbi:protein CLEC16A-like [Hydractinia symbiolongicarpus]|uniref:protein CLEC16A-like n=1 Tax=Hydractinia symbiolongicarpus TaxID=13093 RepID=UPI00255029FD|nr:protein CLEC16A-like [Hydractinia symbiolongicarpus]
MLQKPKNWIAETLWKPKKTHSLEQLRYLHYILQRNSTVTEGNKGLVVETLRSIAEILIWGDQNDSSVFDFFLEKNMLLFFLKFMTQNCGSYVTVQLLQTLNILFENIRHQTSLYFLLSNNHVNSIIVHKFDFSNEEVLAYYISFLKTLSLKLNMQTINFFFNERKSDFPLYTEAIKFFHHSESMVRIAVRTLTLNVYKVGHEKMLEFICDKTATPYFSNLIWLIGKDAIELDDCVLQESDHFKYDKLKASVADHLDHLHYLNDILLLKINVLNMILTDHMINRLLIPLYVYSLPSKEDLGDNDPERVHISKLVALFLLAQHLLIMEHTPLVNAIVDVLFNEDEIQSTAYHTATPDVEDRMSLLSNASSSSRAFIPPPAPLESQLEAYGVTRDTYNLNMKLKLLTSDKSKRNSTFYVSDDGTVMILEESSTPSSDKEDGQSDVESKVNDSAEDSDSEQDCTLIQLAQKADQQAVQLQKDRGSDQETVDLTVKEHKTDDLSNLKENHPTDVDSTCNEQSDCETNRCKRIFMKSILKSLDCSKGDGEAFFALCLLFSLLSNKGLDRDLLISIGLALPKETSEYNEEILEKLILFLEQGIEDESKMRLVTFEMCIKVIRLLVIDSDVKRLSDRHFAMIENIREASTLHLRNFYKGDDLFVDSFEGEYHHMKAKPLNVEYVTMDASLLLPATVTPLTGIDFIKRLPCGDAERTQRAAHIFILMRELTLDLQGDVEEYLPLSKVINPVKENQVLDLNNSDLIACTIVQQGKQSIRRFLVIDTSQFILVEPDTSKLGWGVVKFVSHLQDVEANPDKDDSRSLHIVIQQPFTRRSKSGFNPLPILSAKFVFDDYIRCMSARQRLQKRRDALKHRKMSSVAVLLELPQMVAPATKYYSLTSVDSPGAVWSPSSRSYSATRQSNDTQNVTTGSFTMLTPPPSAQKSRLLSPKHEEILKKQTKDVKDGLSNTPNTPGQSASRTSTPLRNNTPSINEAHNLASLLHTSPPSHGPIEITGHDTGRIRTGTTEVGEEICEDTVTLANSSAFVLINNKTSVERDTQKKDGAKTDRETYKTVSKKNEEKTANFSSQSDSEFTSCDVNVNKTEVLKRCGSAPGSPRGRRNVRDTACSAVKPLSKSLPAMALMSSTEERRQRAQRARAKAKSVRTRVSSKKLSKR